SVSSATDGAQRLANSPKSSAGQKSGSSARNPKTNFFILVLQCRHSLKGAFMSTADAFIRVRLDKELKSEASEILSAMGLSISDLVRMTLTKLVNERDIPFSTYVPNKETIEAMNEKPEELKTYSSFAELLKEVDKEIAEECASK
ncbi:MAG: type II toxin-antitoxin system RelB/DinJ family antitoxin, partial [Parasutterella excrementihominis]